MAVLVKILGSLWLLFFLITIAVIGTSFALPLYFPVYGLSFLFPRLRRLPDEIMLVGIHFLMWVQPWFNGDLDIRVPRDRSRGVLFVSNHRSHLDVFLLLARIAGIRVLAKSTLFQIPFLGLMMRASRQIGVRRGRIDAWVRAMEDVRVYLRSGERVHVFPEMTRCSPGFQGVQPFTAGPFLAAMQENAVVIPMVIRGTDEVWPKGQMGLNFRRAVVARTLEPLNARDFANVDQLKHEVHRRIELALR